MTNYHAALLASCSALAIVLALVAAREFDLWLRNRLLLGRARRRKGWLCR